MKLLALGLAIFTTMPAVTASNPTITIRPEPVEGHIVIERTPQRFVREGMEIRPQTRGYMRVIPTYRLGETVQRPYTLEPDPQTQMPDLDAPNFRFRPLQRQQVTDAPKS